MRMILLAPALLAACVSTAADGPTRDQRAFQRDIAERVAGETERCLPYSSSSTGGVRIVDNRTVVYRVGGTLWVNTLRGECPGLRPGDTLITEPFGSSLCDGDRLRALQPGSSIPGPTCLFGRFTPYRPRG